MAAFDRVFADVRKDLPSVADAVVRQEIFRVMDDFTQRTNIWQEGTPVVIEPNVQTYNLTVSYGQPNRLMFVYDANASTKYWPMSGITMRIPGVLQLYRPPNNAATWIAIIAKRTAEPVDPDTMYPVIDDWIVDKYADCLGRGILARLLWEPQKPYSNPTLAVANQKAYISGCSLARANDSHTNVFDAQSWMYPQGWSTVTRKPWT
jgi:hypothetical protein